MKNGFFHSTLRSVASDASLTRPGAATASKDERPTSTCCCACSYRFPMKPPSLCIDILRPLSNFTFLFIASQSERGACQQGHCPEAGPPSNIWPPLSSSYHLLLKLAIRLACNHSRGHLSLSKIAKVLEARLVPIAVATTVAAAVAVIIGVQRVVRSDSQGEQFSLTHTHTHCADVGLGRAQNGDKTRRAQVAAYYYCSSCCCCGQRQYTGAAASSDGFWARRRRPSSFSGRGNGSVAAAQGRSPLSVAEAAFLRPSVRRGPIHEEEEEEGGARECVCVYER